MSKKEGKTFLFICLALMLVGIIHGCNNNVTTTSLSPTTTSVTTTTTTTASPQTSATTSVTTSEELQTTSTGETNTGIDTKDEFLKLVFYTLETGSVSFAEKTAKGQVPKTLNLENAQIRTDGTPNKVNISYDKASLTVSITINDTVVYENKNAIDFSADAIKIEAIDNPVSGSVMLTNLVIEGDESIKTQKFFNTRNVSTVIDIEQAVFGGEDQVISISFDFVVLTATKLGEYDAITFILGKSS